jgi:hypothetical protein
VGLPDSWRAEEEYVLFLLKEGERRQFGHAGLVDRRLEGEVETVKGVQCREARKLERIADPTALASRELLLEESIEQVGIGS